MRLKFLRNKFTDCNIYCSRLHVIPECGVCVYVRGMRREHFLLQRDALPLSREFKFDEWFRQD